MAAFPARGGMVFHPYAMLDQPKSKFVSQVLKGQLKRYPQRVPITGRWVHHPHLLIKEALRGGTIATAIGQGNFATRNFRQKPIVGLIKAEHKRAPVKAKGSVVAIPTVSSRRTKTYKNKILGKVKAMPYRKKTTYKRKSRPRRRRNFRKKKIPLGFPRSKLVRFRMVGYNTLSGAAGAIATQAFKANSLNDPAGAAGAQLPLTLDQWAAFYEKYIVIGSKITVRFGTTANTGPINVGIHLHKNDTALTSVVHYRELPMTRIKTLTTQKDGGIITMKYSAKKFWHLTNIKDDSEQEGGFSTTPTDPTDIAYYHVFCQDMAGAQLASVDYQFELEFICLLNEPINIARSSL